MAVQRGGVRRVQLWAGSVGDAHQPGRGAVEKKHSTDVDSPPPPPRVCMSIHPESRACSVIGRVLVLNDPPARCRSRVCTSTPSSTAWASRGSGRVSPPYPDCMLILHRYTSSPSSTAWASRASGRVVGPSLSAHSAHVHTRPVQTSSLAWHSIPDCLLIVHLCTLTASSSLIHRVRVQGERRPAGSVPASPFPGPLSPNSSRLNHPSKDRNLRHHGNQRQTLASGRTCPTDRPLPPPPPAGGQQGRINISFSVQLNHWQCLSGINWDHSNDSGTHML